MKTIAWNITNTPVEELMSRRERVLKRLEKEGVKGMVFFSAKFIRYLCNGAFIPTERPIGMVMRADGYTALMVPHLEFEHAHDSVVNIDKIIHYGEYPGERNPMYDFCDLLTELGLGEGALAADAPHYPDFWGSRCPALTSILPQLELKLMPRFFDELRIIKSDFDLKGIRESARWGSLAMSLLQKYSTEGTRELAAESRATNEATATMLECLGGDFVPSTVGMGSARAHAGYRGQIGANSFFPHAIATNAPFRKGEIMGSGASAALLEYCSELERIFFMGEPSKDQLFYYNHAVAAQLAAIDVIKPGVECAAVDAEMMRYFKDNNLTPYWRHHTGHALGFEGHELPFLDIHDHTIIEPGMVFSIEPGIYVEGLGGFRLSDTVAIHEDSVEMITYYPREVDKLICY